MKDNADYEKAKEHLLALADLLASHENAQQFRAQFILAQENAFASDTYRPTARHRVITVMTGCLYDGLAYGNWPRFRGNITEY